MMSEDKTSSVNKDNVQQFGGEPVEPKRPFWRSAWRGLLQRCPNCGRGNIFARFLKVRDHCETCGEALHHHRADDLPAYLNILIVGHVVVGAMVVIMSYDLMGMWTTMLVTIGIATLCAIALMQPLKGMVVGTQWALFMHGFGGEED